MSAIVFISNGSVTEKRVPGMAHFLILGLVHSLSIVMLLRRVGGELWGSYPSPMICFLYCYKMYCYCFIRDFAKYSTENK